MKKINLEKLMSENGLDVKERMRILGMEFIKNGDKWLIKGSNGIVVDEKEKLKLEQGELVIKDVESNLCQKKNIKKLKEINKKLKEVEKDEPIEETEQS